MSASVMWRFGALSPKLSEQATAQGLSLSKSRLDPIQKDADAVVRLHIRGVLTDSEKHKALRRIVKNLDEATT